MGGKRRRMSAQGICDYHNVAGNTYDKYSSTNPIARHLMRGFLESFGRLVDRAAPRTVFEIGCGEGYLCGGLLERGIDVHGCDLDDGIVTFANAASAARGFGNRFHVRSIYDIAPGEIAADLLVCCEVLEHLPDPEAALAILAAQNCRHLLFSVPREPIWRVLNMARGKYWGDLGNTPGHLQHWSASAFRRMIARRWTIEERLMPLPWCMVLCSPKKG
jgi:2-polyprenyl-3-methyl-5-hydroxy-6-metoxy-1,4-benzoquinol methylase